MATVVLCVREGDGGTGKAGGEGPPPPPRLLHYHPLLRRWLQEESAALAERRLREKARITALDTYNDAAADEDTRWYIISDSWLQKWRAFIDNCESFFRVCVGWCWWGGQAVSGRFVRHA